MNKQLIYIPGLLALGIVTGIAIMYIRGNESPTIIHRENEVPVADVEELYQSDSNSWNAANEPGSDADARQTLTIEDKVSELEARVLELEQMVASKSEINSNTHASRGNSRANLLDRMLTTQALIKGGVSQDMA
jgi:hypothetical protein